MDEKVKVFNKTFQETTEGCERFCFLSRSQAFQLASIRKLQKLKQEATELKEEMINIADEDSANAMLSFEERIDGLTKELGMWLEFKKNNPGKAWDYLIRAQAAIQNAMQAHSIASHLTNYMKKLDLLEMLLFPPQTFLSSEIIYGRSECSICGHEYGTCDHIIGKAYMGKSCCQIIREIKAFKGASIVKNPSNKSCRVISIPDKGITRDFMTWQAIPKNSFKKVIQRLTKFLISLFKKRR